MFTDAGHIIGSACVHLQIQENGKQTALTFSGDVGRYRDVILKSPEDFPQADYIIMESTYGNSLHEMNLTTPDMLLQWIQKTCLQKKAVAVTVNAELIFLQLKQQKQLINKPYKPYQIDIY